MIMRKNSPAGLIFGLGMLDIAARLRLGDEPYAREDEDYRQRLTQREYGQPVSTDTVTDTMGCT